MSLSGISIRRPVFAWMLMLGLITFGAIAFQRMGISEMPDVDFPVVNIGLELDNAAPEIMEMNVVDVVEDAVMGIEGLKNVTSTSSQGVANVTCEFALDHNINVAMQEVEDRINQAKNLLPTALDPPVITKTNPEDQPILWAMLTADSSVPTYKQMIYARNTLKDQLSTIAGVGSVTLAGYVDPNLRVWIDSQKMYKFDLTTSDILSAITSEQIEQPAGRIENPEQEFNVRVFGETKSAEDFAKIRINTRAGQPNYNPIRLGQVARVEEGVSDLRAISRFDGRASVGLGIVKQHGANAVEVSNLVHRKVDELRARLLPGFHLDVRLDTTRFIRSSVRDLDWTLLLSALMTSIVCFLFLGSWSSTINVWLAIPTSIVGTFIALYFFGFTLNTFTLLGLSLAIGIVVDDAIMMLENIVRHYEMGKNRLTAAVDGSEEISFAAISATFAIAAIFIPVIFMQGVIGRFFYQYGVTVTVAVFLSLLEALTLTPMRCARFMQSAKRTPGGAKRGGRILTTMDSCLENLARRYRKSLEISLRHRGAVIFISIAFFCASLIFAAALPKELIPPQDQSLFVMNIKAPVGTSIWATDAIFKKAESYLKSLPEVQHLYSTIGNYQENDIVNAGVIYVILKDAKDRNLSQRRVMDRARAGLRELLPKEDIFAQDLSLTGMSATRGYPIEFTLEGPDWNELSKLHKAVAARLQRLPMITDLNTDYQDGMPEIHVTPDRDKAAGLGVTVNNMGTELETLIGGHLFNSNTKYPLAGHRYGIRVRSEADRHASLADIEGIEMRNNRGGTDLIALPQTARIDVTRSLQLISRLNRQRAIRMFANVKSGESQELAIIAVEKAVGEILPPGYRAVMTGAAQAFRDSFAGLVFALILGIAVAYMILASQFNSFIHPITVLMALPFSLSGAVIALVLMHQSLNLFSMIGLVLLMGIVKKNSILLVDFTNQRRGLEGLTPTQALLDACPVRLRPILMTSAACVAGALPAAIHLGPGAETRMPMATAIIGGVLVSTLLTLYVVPCVYSVFTRLERPDRVEKYNPSYSDLSDGAAN